MSDNMTIYRDLDYAGNGYRRQRLDLYLPPAAGPLPLLIWVHGGAFRMGSKADKVPLSYVEDGFAVASLNYRLSQQALFPAQIVDVKAAVRWLRAHAAAYNIDPNRFGAWGESAGGHLVAMLGVSGHVTEFEVGEHLNVSSHVQAVVDHFGPTDFLQMDAHRLAGGMVHDVADSPESELVGGPIQEHPERVAAANPVTYVRGDAAPFLIVHGDQDPLVPYHQSVLLKAALESAGVPVSFYTVAGEGHGNFRDPEVAVMTRDFLLKHLKG